MSEVTNINKDVDIEILSRGLKVIIWGMGYIGLSSGMRFVKAGLPCLGYDINEDLIQQLTIGRCSFPGFEKWMDCKLADVIDEGFSFSSNIESDKLNQADVHLVSVNTDLEGEPFKDNLIKVIRNIVVSVYTVKKRYIIIQSTIAVEWLDEINKILDSGLKKGQFVLVVAPRRDWFIGQDKKNQKTIPQVIGADAKDEISFLMPFFSLVSDQVLVAKDCKHAALVKTIENTLRYLNIVFTNQLVMEYPDMDIAGVMNLCSSKWNIPHYHPSLGIGGYCIPIAPKYVLPRLSRDNKLNRNNEACLLSSALAVEKRCKERLGEILNTKKGKKVLVLGISYAPNINIIKLSPALELIKKSIDRGDEVYAHDPYFTADEILNITGASYYDYESKNLDFFDQVFVVSCHNEYKSIADKISNDNTQKRPVIIDNMGELKFLAKDLGINYFEIGSGKCPQI